MRRLSAALVYLFVALALGIGTAALPGEAADHRDWPGIQRFGLLDITDFYAFQAPTVQAFASQPSAEPTNAVLIMGVNPFAGIEGPTTFSSTGAYEFLIDTNGDAKEDSTFTVTFSAPDAAGKQLVTIKSGGVTLGSGPTGATIPLANGGKLMAGLFDDPYFFDSTAFGMGMQFCPGGKGNDFYYGLNVNAIVLELPISLLGMQFGAWTRTLENGKQLNRVGIPGVPSFLIANDKREAFAAAKPADDENTYTAEVVASLKALGHDDASAARVAQLLLPDILPVNLSTPTTFASLNGRQLRDDVVDTALALITNGQVTSDCVGNDSEFRSSFPYLAVANPTAQMPGLPNTGAGGAQAANAQRWWAIPASLGCLALAGACAAIGLRTRRR